MAITISNTRKLPAQKGGRGAPKDPDSFRSILERMTAGQSFFVEDDGEYARSTLQLMPSKVAKATGQRFTTRRMTENGKLGTAVFCIASAPAAKLVRSRA